MDETTLVPEKRKMAWWVKVLIGLGILIGTIVLLFGAFITAVVIASFKYQDIEPIDDSDLALQVIMLPPNGNGTLDVLKELETVEKNDGARATEIFARAAQAGGYQDLALLDPAQFSFDAVLPPLSAFRAGASSSQAYILSSYRAGTLSGETAFTGLKNILKISAKIEDSRSNTVDQMFAIAMSANASRAVIELAKEYEGEPEVLAEAAWDIREYEPSGRGIVEALKVEYQHHKHQFLLLTEGTDTPAELEEAPVRVNSFTYFPNETLGYFADDTREKIAMFSAGCEVEPRIESERRFPSNMLLVWFTPNVIGKVLIDVMGAATYTTVRDRQCDGLTEFRVARSILLIRSEEIRTGAVPASVVDATITDPYSGKSFVYDSVRRELRSVGSDHILNTEDDLVFSF